VVYIGGLVIAGGKRADKNGIAGEKKRRDNNERNICLQKED